MRYHANGHVLERVDDYLHDLLPAAQADWIEQHCAICPICSAALQEARKRFGALEAVPSSEASESLIRRTVERVERYESVRSRRRRLLLRGCVGSAVAAVVVLGALHLYYLNLGPTPYDLRLLGQKELLAGTTASIRVQLTNRERQAPVAGVPVDIDIRRPDQPFIRLASFTTDDRGTGQPRLQLPDWSDGSYELRITAHASGSPEVITRSIKLKRSWKLMLTSDKPVYQPNQTIHLRALAMRQLDLRPVAGQDATYTVADAKGNIIFKQRAVTSAYGITSADCALADEIIEGSYTVGCKMGDTESKLSVEVKKYVLPKYKIQIELDKPYYQPGDIVRGKLEAAYFFGKPVAGVTASIEIDDRSIGKNQLANLAARTNEKGQAAFGWRVPERLIGQPQQSGDARLGVAVTLTDTAGQKESKTLALVVTNHPLRLELMPEGGALVKDVANTVYIFTSYADGSPAEATINISGRTESLRTSALGVASFEITPKDTGALMISARDAHGYVVTRELAFPGDAPTDDFLVRTDKAVYRGGETMHLIALGSGSEPIFVDVLKDGQVLLTTSMGLSNGRGEYALDLPPDVFGTLEVRYYRFGSYGLPSRKSRVVYVETVRQVQIAAALDRAEYRPGQQARLAITLKDASGKPIAGAVSLAAVDEAVYAVLDRAPGMESTFFNLEQELLKPVYAIYPWSPDLATRFPPGTRQQFEQALFARTAKRSASQADVFQRMLDQGYISPRSLEALQDANADEALEKGWVSDELVRLIKGDQQSLLSASTYPAKKVESDRQRMAALGMLQFVWVLLGVCGALGTLIGIYMYSRSAGIVVAVVLGCFLLVSIMLPSLSRARSQSKKVASMAALHGLDIGLEMFRNNFRAVSHGGLMQPPKSADDSPVRVREWFPETLLWRPEIITDDHGRASIDVDLADSITTWRVTGSAVTGDGRLGSLSSAIRVFQPFFVDLNLPVSLTRGDEVAVPVVVYNYLDKPQTVELRFERAGWFEPLGELVQRVELKASEVKSVSFRLSARQVGHGQLQVTARGQGVEDAIRRDVEVAPDGQRVEQVFNGNLQNPADLSLSLPAEAIEASVKAILKIYPSTFSQLVEGLDGIFQRPYGCFEQTSSTTYPNVLALDYLRRTNKALPQVEAKARQYIHLGYQRLLGFEISGGGFDWFGRPPANRTLTAYGLIEFEDMARVHDVDPALIARTREWLLQQRRSDGSWAAESHAMHEDPTLAGGRSEADLSTTAYIAWAVFGNPSAQAEASRTIDWLVGHRPDEINNSYVLALTINALRAMDAGATRIEPYIQRLSEMSHISEDGKQIWWTQPTGAWTGFYGSGVSGEVETTALAVLAMIGRPEQAGTIRLALSWLVAQKDASGTWPSTQATVLALKALLAGTGQPLGGETERQIEVAVDAAAARKLLIPADQAEVVKQLDLSGEIATGNHRVRLAERGNAGSIYQLSLRYHVPGPALAGESAPLVIDLSYDRAELAVSDHVTATAVVTNRMPVAAPMVILDLPVPPGFALETSDLDKVLASGEIAKYQVNARSAVVYLRSLPPGRTITLKYRLVATMPVEVSAPAARVYEYYDPGKQALSRGARLTVRLRA